MVGLTISTHFQQFEDLKFLNFSGGACRRTPPPKKNPSRVSNRPELGENVSILLENSESQLELSQDTSIPILKNIFHKSTSREIFFVKLS